MLFDPTPEEGYSCVDGREGRGTVRGTPGGESCQVPLTIILHTGQRPATVTLWRNRTWRGDYIHLCMLYRVKTAQDVSPARYHWPSSFIQDRGLPLSPCGGTEHRERITYVVQSEDRPGREPCQVPLTIVLHTGQRPATVTLWRNRTWRGDYICCTEWRPPRTWALPGTTDHRSSYRTEAHHCHSVEEQSIERGLYMLCRVKTAQDMTLPGTTDHRPSYRTEAHHCHPVGEQSIERGYMFISGTEWGTPEGISMKYEWISVMWILKELWMSPNQTEQKCAHVLAKVQHIS